MLILNSGVCEWKGCFFCGYGKIACDVKPADSLKGIFDNFFRELDAKAVKVFCSGSFFDDRQFSRDARLYVASNCRRSKLDDVIVESRPEYLTKENLSNFKGVNLTVAIGLETSDDTLLKKINKGFTREDYERAAEKVHKHGFKLRTYLLVNLPFQKDWKKKLKESVDYALRRSDSIVLINLLPHADAELFSMWVDGEWNYLTRDEFYEVTSQWKDSQKIEFDAETFNFIPRFPKRLRQSLKGVGEEYLLHPHFEVWQDYLARWYRPPEGRSLLLLPCSYKKPYSQSETHRNIIGVLEETGTRNRFHEVMLSNAGVIPREFEDYYPFNSYDWDERLETDEIKERYVEVTSERIEKYLKAHAKSYDGILCYLKYGSDSYKALENAAGRLKADFRNLLDEETYARITAEKQPLKSKEALNDFRSNIRLWSQRDSTS
ncbi:MAG: DUF5591 domain-containing protein [Candidatus Altiarchaeota archaeon]